ncbi:unnamed protein product [Closterium sp. NIES-65]|nr:unnamed protein product [Closterium sp. NIES-65]
MQGPGPSPSVSAAASPPSAAATPPSAVASPPSTAASAALCCGLAALPCGSATVTCGLAAFYCGLVALCCGLAASHLLQRRPPPQLPDPPHLAEQPTAAPPCSSTAEPPGHRSSRTAETPSRPAAEPPSSRAAQQLSRPTAEPPSSRAAQQLSRPAAEPPCSRAAEPPSNRAAQQPSRPAAEPPSSRAAQQPSRRAAELPELPSLGSSLSLFDLTSGASPAPAADADATVRSQWATRDAAAGLAVRRHLSTSERAHFSQYKSAQTLYDAVVARYSSPATTALSRLILPYLFPDLAAFPTVADLITHLRTSDTRYRAALPADFCAKNPPPPCTSPSTS